MMSLIVAALLIGLVAGLRAMTAPAIASWATALGWIGVVQGWPAFMGYHWTPAIFTVAALAEWVTDQVPSTPSRKVPPQFATRIVMGALSGATLGAAHDGWIAGLVLGALGAVIGTIGGATVRTRLATAFGNDHPAAFLEDAVAIGIGAVAVVAAA